MDLEQLKRAIGKIDIYLLDQILKGRYEEKTTILDVGCGNGRNLKWFYHNGYDIYGVDTNTKKIEEVKAKYTEQSALFSVQNIDALDFEGNKFDHLICCAILHFAKSEEHLKEIFSELVRVLKPNGTIFIRMATIESLEHRVKLISDGVYHLPDGTDRFLLTPKLLENLLITFNLELIDPMKYVNVNNKRCMATFILQKRE